MLVYALGALTCTLFLKAQFALDVIIIFYLDIDIFTEILNAPIVPKCNMRRLKICKNVSNNKAMSYSKQQFITCRYCINQRVCTGALVYINKTKHDN